MSSAWMITSSPWECRSRSWCHVWGSSIWKRGIGFSVIEKEVALLWRRKEAHFCLWNQSLLGNLEICRRFFTSQTKVRYMHFSPEFYPMLFEKKKREKGLSVSSKRKINWKMPLPSSCTLRYLQNSFFHLQTIYESHRQTLVCLDQNARGQKKETENKASQSYRHVNTENWI